LAEGQTNAEDAEGRGELSENMAYTYADSALEKLPLSLDLKNTGDAMDTLSNAMTALKNAESSGHGRCEVGASKLVGSVLRVFKEYNYIKGFEYVGSKKGGKYVVELSGRINDCGAVKPRFSVKKADYEKFEKRFLPARDFGILIVSTVDGVISQKEAIKRGMGGVLLAYVY
jgi:small subunit ribosomal protein S8